MASFSASANAFLSNPYVEKVKGPNAATERGCGFHLNAHPKEPHRLIYPSGKYIIVKNIENPTDTFIYRGHATTTTVAKFSPNGFWVASGDVSGKVRVWSWDNPEHPLKLETIVFSGAISDIDWDFESKKLVAVGEGSGMMAKVFLWDTGNSVGEMVGHNKKILSVAYKPTRPFRIMTASEDMRTVFYAGPPFKLSQSSPSHSNFVNCVRYSPDGNHIVSVGSDKKIQFYNGASGDIEGEIVDAHAGSIYSVSFSPDSLKFITASADKTVKLWDVASKTCEQTFLISAEPQVGDMQVSVLWSANYLFSVSLNGNINVLDPATPSAPPARVIQSHQVSVTALCLDTTAQTLYTGSFDGVVCAHDLISNNTSRLQGKDKRSVCGGSHSNKVTGLAYSNETLISVGWDDTIRFADPRSLMYHSEKPLSGQPSALVVGSVAGLIAVATNKGVDFFHTIDQVAAISGTKYQPTCIAISPNEEEIAVGGDDSKTHIYSVVDLSNIIEVATIETRTTVTAVSYSPAGDALAIGDAGRQVEVYERVTGTWTARVKGKWVFHTSRITSLAWSPSGSYLASGSLDESIIVWNCEKPSSKLQYQFAHMAGVTAITFLGEDRLISTGNDHSIITWRVPTAESW